MSEKTSVQNELIFDEDYLSRAAEAAIFAYGSAIPFEKLAQAIETEEKYIPQILDTLAARYKKSAVELLILDGHAQFATRNEYADIVRNALEIRRNQPLSRAALEVLAIIAYNQPATRALVDKVRGVESPSVIMSLCDKGLIEEKGRLDAPGRPLLYGTTTVFLRTFGLESIDDLELVPELAEFTRQIKAQREELMLAAEKNDDKNAQLSLDGDFVQTHISVQNIGVNVEGETAPDAVQEGNGADTDGNGNGQNGEQINE